VRGIRKRAAPILFTDLEMFAPVRLPLLASRTSAIDFVFRFKGVVGEIPDESDDPVLHDLGG